MRRLLLLSLLACSSSTEPARGVPTQPGSPWPKFRYDAAQTGLSPIKPKTTGGAFWDFRTGKGIYSSPIVAADGTLLFGSADRTFYALAPDGSLKWKVDTGEIIDSAGLIDDRGVVYFGSGDGKLRALDAKTGAPKWTMEADDPAVNKAFIRWFEGNVAMTTDGALLVPNDNFFVYSIARDTGAVEWRYKMPDQTWSSPAWDHKANTLFIGNNNLLPVLGKNTFAISRDGQTTHWAVASLGTVAASPMRVGDLVIVGGFDGYAHAYAADDGAERWKLATRDHIYASPALLPDGTVVQASADGTVYGVAQADGAVKWTFDASTPIRSSPSVDGLGNIYVGGGDGRLYVLGPDGKMRWSMLLITEARNDLNSSPALGRDAIYIGGENGQMFSVPYEYCVRPENKGDPRCSLEPPAAPDGGTLALIGPFGDPAPLPSLDANGRVVLALSVRERGTSKLAILDAKSVKVTSKPQTEVSVEISGDGKFMSIEPKTVWPAGPLELEVEAPYLVNLDRLGLRLSGGAPGGTARATVKTTVPAPTAGAMDASAIYELRRMAVPLPTVMPSYNQIGFDSLHYLMGTVERNANKGVVWMIGGILPEGKSASAPDPATKALFPLVVDLAGDVATLRAAGELRVQISNFELPFKTFRVATRFLPGGDPAGTSEIAGSSTCAQIGFYGPFLQQLGLCNPQTDIIRPLGATDVIKRTDLSVPPAIGAVTFGMSNGAITATITGSMVKPSEHVVSLLVVDAQTGEPAPLDYAFGGARTTAPDGTLTSLSVPATTLPAQMRVYVMVDTFAAAQGTL